MSKSNQVRLLTAALRRGWLQVDEAIGLALSSPSADVVLEKLEERLGVARLAALHDLLDSSDARDALTLAQRSMVSFDEPTVQTSRLSESPGSFTGARYVSQSIIGEGGEGRVMACVDQELGRHVALKLPHGKEPHKVAHFLTEARLTSRLEHPNIVPIYDLGQLDDGSPFYAMRVIERRSLRDVIRADNWSLVRLLGVFTQVAHALDYAHRRGVLHGDVKPSNILLGGSGEVYLADWGLARLRTEAPFAVSEAPIQLPAQDVGTPGYMAPELYGEAMIDARADLFALGVVLYQILAREHPFTRDDTALTVIAACFDNAKPPNEIDPSCPLTLSDLCLSLLEKEPANRPTSAAAVASAVEAYLEGDRERARRRDEARELCRSAESAVATHRALLGAQLAAEARATVLARDVKSWETIERKRGIWQEEDRAAEAARGAARAMAEAIELYTKALGYDAASAEAHRGLGALYWDRRCRAETRRDHAERIYFETLTLEHDLDDTYAGLVTGRATLLIEAQPRHATATLHRFNEVDRRLALQRAEPLGTLPHELVVDPGSYLVVVEAEGYRTSRYPVFLERGDRHEASIKLYTPDEVGSDLVVVSGGGAIIGGDADAPDALSRSKVEVGDFAIGRHPVTMGDYLAFVDTLSEEEVLRRIPHDLRGSEGIAAHRDEAGKWTPSEQMIEGDARELFPADEGHLWRVPANLIDWYDARAYCRWRSARDDTFYRLPAEVEWEKAARGVDGRFFPWGDSFDAAFCKMRESRPFAPQPEPIGTFVADASPYGVRDMAGCIREWICDIHGERDVEACWNEAEPSPETERGDSSMRMVRAGSWSSQRVWCRSASRSRHFALTRGTALGFRLLQPLATPPQER